jgi:hypothetical protein|tara:strand:+ start:7398 stop:7562 length:165 start_codon:yes stop_codon:yes gene_type:complete
LNEKEVNKEIQKEIRKEYIKTGLVLIACYIGIYFFYTSTVKQIDAEQYLKKGIL